MKKLLLVTAALVLIATLSGCLSTLQPLFTEKDLVFDPRLAGSWKTVKDHTILRYERGSAASFRDLPAAMQLLADKAYVLTVTDNSTTEEFRYYAFLVKLGNEYYLDYYPAENRWQQGYDAVYKQQLIKMHSIYRLRFTTNNSVEISQFDEKYLRDLIDKNKIRIKHEKYFDGSYIITASTGELQQYVLKYGDVQDAYYKDGITTYNKIN